MNPINRYFLAMASLLLLNVPLLAANDINDRVALEAFVDGVMNSSMLDKHVAGAVVTIVADNEIVLSKGYGFADVEKKVPVDPERTLFRIGSVTKLFTWTALMQLYEQGKIDLHTDVNNYLNDITIPDTFGEPITIAHLMTHTGGLEDRIINLFADSPDSVRPYSEILAVELPDRVRAPGKVSSYSNHGVGVAGLIVEDVSGMSWADYVQKNIMDPLNMEYATGFQPIPDVLGAYMSRGYQWTQGKLVEKDFEYVPLGAAGGISASGGAMARFMMMNLNQGSLGETTILSEETTNEMHSSLFDPYGDLNSWLHGFMEYSRNGKFMLGHGGGTFWFFTQFALIPDDNIGLFISTNSVSGNKVHGALFKAFMDRYYPHDFEMAPLARKTDMSSFVGSYATYRHPHTSPAKLLRLMSSLDVSLNDEEQLVLLGGGPDPTYWNEISPLLFQHTDSENKLTFDTDEEGNARMFIGSAGSSFYLVSGIHSPAFHFVAAGFSMLMFLWALIAWPVQWLRRQDTLEVHLKRSRISAWWLAFLVVLISGGVAASASQEIVYGLSTVLRVYLGLGYLVLVLTGINLLLLTKLVRVSSVNRRVRVYHVCLTASGLMVCWLMYYWNLIGWEGDIALLAENIT